MLKSVGGMSTCHYRGAEKIFGHEKIFMNTHFTFSWLLVDVDFVKQFVSEYKI